jgi:hypothetical protein
MLLGVLGAWHGLAATQNAFDVLATTGIAPGLRPLAAKNFELIAKAAMRLRPSQKVIAVLLSGVVVVESGASLFFLRSAFAGKNIEAPFALSLGLFGAFFLIDDALDDYDLGEDHRAIFTMLAASYAAIRAAGE